MHADDPDARFDAIVIGSGVGGLASAALLARMRGWRVLVLERHDRVGGFTHTFKRPGGFEWDTGVHYCGQLEQGSAARKLFDYISQGRLAWRRLPEPFDIFEYPDFTFAQSAGAGHYLRSLIAMFPGEASALARYLRDIKRATTWQNLNALFRGKRGPLPWLVKLLTRKGRRLGLSLTADYLAAHFSDPRLRALLASTWLDYGLPPSQAAFAVHSLLVQHYFDGAWYPEGGSAAIAASICPTIERNGGKVKLRCEATQVLMDGNRAIGVEADIGKATERYYAPRVFSGIGAWNTYTRLLPAGVASKQVAELRALRQPGLSLVTLYVGFKDDPRKLGFTGANHWFIDSYEHEKNVLAKGSESMPSYAVLSFGSLKAGSPGPHTAEIMAVAAYAHFAEWGDRRWKNRGADYDALKKQISEGLLELVERRHPGFRELVATVELSTPLSIEHFAGAYLGGAYGAPATPARFGLSALTPATPVAGLYLTGADALSFGIVGAAMGAVASVGRELGPLGFFRVMTAVYRAAAKNRP